MRDCWNYDVFSLLFLFLSTSLPPSTSQPLSLPTSSPPHQPTSLFFLSPPHLPPFHLSHLPPSLPYPSQTISGIIWPIFNAKHHSGIFFVLYCYNLKDGSIQWEKTLKKQPSRSIGAERANFYYGLTGQVIYRCHFVPKRSSKINHFVRARKAS